MSDPNSCPKCGKPVYAAEERLAGGNKYHKAGCFKCEACNRALDSTNAASQGKELFCRNCHQKKFGPTRYL